MRPTIHTEKHIVQASLFAVASGAMVNTVIAVGKQDPDKALAVQVREGAVVSAIYVEMWLTSDDIAAGTAIVTLEKRPSGLPSMTAAESAALDSYDNKKNVIHTFMGLVPTNLMYPVAAIKGWFKIPKGKQRMGINDNWMLNIHGQSNGLAACGFFLFKEQY